MKRNESKKEKNGRKKSFPLPSEKLQASNWKSDINVVSANNRQRSKFVLTQTRRPEMNTNFLQKRKKRKKTKVRKRKRVMTKKENSKWPTKKTSKWLTLPKMVSSTVQMFEGGKDLVLSRHDGGEQKGKGRFNRKADGRRRWWMNLTNSQWLFESRNLILHCGHESVAVHCSDPQLQVL